jgi:hypothetical protein
MKSKMIQINQRHLLNAQNGSPNLFNVLKTLNSPVRILHCSIILSVALLSACASPQPLQVPVTAEIVAYGAPPPPFYPPKYSRTIYVKDEETGKVVYVTRAPDIAAGEQPTPIQLSQLGQQLNPDHHYLVYCVGKAPEADSTPPPVAVPATQP